MARWRPNRIRLLVTHLASSYKRLPQAACARSLWRIQGAGTSPLFTERRLGHRRGLFWTQNALGEPNSLMLSNLRASVGTRSRSSGGDEVREAGGQSSTGGE